MADEEVIRRIGESLKGLGESLLEMLTAEPEPSEWVSTSVASELTGISPRTIQNWAKTGVISSRKKNKRNIEVILTEVKERQV